MGWRCLARALETHIKAFDEQREDRLALLRQHFLALTGRLESAARQQHLRSRLRSLGRTVPERTAHQTELVALTAELAELQAAVLGGLEQDTAAAGGLWSRWLQRNKAPGAAVPAMGEVAAMPEPRVDAGLVADVGRVVDSLLRQVDPPDDVMQAYMQARRLVLDGLDSESLLPALEAASQVVIAALDGHQSEFQAFLVTLNERLEETGRWLDGSRRLARDRQQAGQALDDSLRSEVQAMQHQVCTATDLRQLQVAIGARLDGIIQAVDTFHSEEVSRESRSQEEIERLQGRLLCMEQDARQTQQWLAEQRQRALCDALTGLPNRQAYDERLEHEFERWRRYGHALTLAIFDIDHFKSINDRYGHLAGDRVLKLLARTLRQRLRATDFLARFGGEEFVLLLPETRADQAQGLLETLREAVAACPFHFREQRVRVTSSIGFAEVQEGDEPDALFERADRSLYRAKRGGRNSSVCAA